MQLMLLKMGDMLRPWRQRRLLFVRLVMLPRLPRGMVQILVMVWVISLHGPL